MKTRLFLIIYFLGFLPCSIFSLSKNPTSSNTIAFRENRGQVADQNNRQRPDVLFSGTDGNFVFHLKQNGISYQLNKINQKENPNSKALQSILEKKINSNFSNDISIYRLDLNWLNTNSNTEIKIGTEIQGYDNFYSESCPNGVLNVKSYKSISYQNIYNGINLKWYEKNNQLKYDYEVAAHADYTQIKWEIKGTENVIINSKNQLVLSTPFGDLIEEAALVFQDGKQLPATWQIKDNCISFQIENIDSNKPFTIDPLVRLWGTYYGGIGNDWLGTSYTDASGNLFICGGSTSNNALTIATTGAYQTTFGGGGSWGDSYLAKFTSSGTRIWGTYFGGTGVDFANCCVVDMLGDIYLSGGTTTTNSAVMASSGCHQSVYGGSWGNGNIGDAFLAKFNTSGARIWSTYIGGAADEFVYGMACDPSNNIYITGVTNSNNGTTIASVGSHQPVFNGGGNDGFLAKFNTTGLRLWSTYYGGSGGEESVACITDALGNVYIGGITSSTNAIATNGCHQNTYAGGVGNNVYGIGDAFAAKFNPAGVRHWGTYYGGAGDEYFYYAACDALGNVYFSGSTSTSQGTIITTTNAHQQIYGGGFDDGMIVKFSNVGARQWGTYYGGSGAEEFCCAWADNNNGLLFISGITTSTSGIATPCIYQDIYGGGNGDGFLAKFSLQGTRDWGTYFGGIGREDWAGLTVDKQGSIYLTGETSSQTGSIITSINAHQTVYGGGTADVFVEKFTDCNPTAPLSSTLQVCKGVNGNLKLPQTCGLKWYADSLGTNLLYTGGIYTTSPLSTDTAFWAQDVSCGTASGKTKIKVHINPTPTLNIAASTTFVCLGETTTLTASGAQTYTWAGTQSTIQTIVLTPTSNLIQPLDGTDANGCKGTKSIYIQFSLCTGLNENSKNINFDFEIYPNPNEGEFSLIANSDFDFSIYNQLGQKVSEFKLKQENNSPINLKNLAKGIYLIVGKKEMQSITRKLIVE